MVVFFILPHLTWAYT